MLGFCASNLFLEMWKDSLVFKLTETYINLLMVRPGMKSITHDQVLC
jgi:hypothetical protein